MTNPEYIEPHEKKKKLNKKDSRKDKVQGIVIFVSRAPHEVQEL